MNGRLPDEGSGEPKPDDFKSRWIERLNNGSTKADVLIELISCLELYREREREVREEREKNLRLMMEIEKLVQEIEWRNEQMEKLRTMLNAYNERDSGCFVKQLLGNFLRQD